MPRFILRITPEGFELNRADAVDVFPGLEIDGVLDCRNLPIFAALAFSGPDDVEDFLLGYTIGVDPAFDDLNTICLLYTSDAADE